MKILSGQGTISVIDTLYGVALKINFSNKIEIHSKIDTTNRIGKYGLTMENKTESYGLKIEHWIYYSYSQSSNNSCIFDLKLEYDSLSTYVTYDFHGYLERGWNTYWGRYEVLCA